ncbi:MAG TPA: hypothetical protein VE487_05530 [Ilumatobacter sp.]|nr:hypothetical protein [Ilumatobacter sp.]
MSPDPSDTDVLAQLALIEAESNVRREELRRIAAELPATVSRRALVRAMFADLRRAPNKGAIVRRGVSKVVRAPLHAAKRMQLRLRDAKSVISK